MDKEQATSRLRHQIVTGYYKPNSLVIEEELMNDLEIGRTPLREILNRLVYEGLITSIPRRGYHISAIDLHLIMDAIEVRKELFFLLSDLLYERITDQDIEELIQFHESHSYNDLADAIGIDCDFHDMLNSYSRNSVLIETLRTQRNIIVRLFINNNYSALCSFIKNDHENIISALKKHDEKILRQCLLSHAQDFLNLTINRLS